MALHGSATDIKAQTYGSKKSQEVSALEYKGPSLTLSTGVHEDDDTRKMKDRLVIDSHRSSPPHISSVTIQGLDSGIHLNNSLVRRMRSFIIFKAPLNSLNNTVLASAVLFTVLCWGGTRAAWNKLVRKSSSGLVSFQEVGEQETS